MTSYYAARREEQCAYSRKYYAAHREARLSYARAYWRSPEGLAAARDRHARHRAARRAFLARLLVAKRAA